MSGISTRGCGSCHGGSANNSVMAQITAPVSSVLPGDVVTVTFELSSSSSSVTYGRLDVSATGGTLHAGGGTKVSSRDLTQTTARAFSGGGTSWDFTWTAPANARTYKIRGAGNAVNHNRSDSGDGWHLAPDLTVTVAADCADDDNDGVTTCDGDRDDHNPNETTDCTPPAGDTDVAATATATDAGGGGGSDTDAASDTDTVRLAAAPATPAGALRRSRSSRCRSRRLGVGARVGSGAERAARVPVARVAQLTVRARRVTSSSATRPAATAPAGPD